MVCIFFMPAGGLVYAPSMSALHIIHIPNKEASKTMPEANMSTEIAFPPSYFGKIEMRNFHLHANRSSKNMYISHPTCQLSKHTNASRFGDTSSSSALGVSVVWQRMPTGPLGGSYAFTSVQRRGRLKLMIEIVNFQIVIVSFGISVLVCRVWLVSQFVRS